MPLPQLKVGQIWQCRNQNYKIKIHAIRGYRVDILYFDYGLENWCNTPHLNRHRRIERDGVYPQSFNYPAYDMTVLLYDPPTA